MNWQGKHVLVTGAGGFIGSHLTESLIAAGAEVTALVKYNSRNDWGLLEGLSRHPPQNLSVLSGDITDSHLIRTVMVDQDMVFHLAALIGIPYSYRAPLSYEGTNIRGTMNVLQAAYECNVERVVHTSTSEVYGSACYTPIDENHPLQGQSPYSATKIGADKIAESYYYAFGLPVAILRPFNTYGPRQSARAVIPTIITQALTSNTVKLGSLSPVRDLTFVDDTVDAFLKIAATDQAIGKTINAGSGKGITIGDLASIIIRLTNPSAQIVCEKERVRPDTSEVMKLICNNKLAQEVLNWRPNFSLEDGLKATIAWMKEHLYAYKPGRYTV
jgi:NAD dependent epimerase/dehydratase